jgi:NADPH:quinone reductase-like Zn-dependent oxidoreductase
MESGDVLGHEFMGEVVEVGRGVTNLAQGDRVVVPFPLSDRSRAELEGFYLNAIARLKPGVSIRQANADIARLIPIWVRLAFRRRDRQPLGIEGVYFVAHRAEHPPAAG